MNRLPPELLLALLHHTSLQNDNLTSTLSLSYTTPLLHHIYLSSRRSLLLTALHHAFGNASLYHYRLLLLMRTSARTSARWAEDGVEDAAVHLRGLEEQRGAIGRVMQERDFGAEEVPEGELLRLIRCRGVLREMEGEWSGHDREEAPRVSGREFAPSAVYVLLKNYYIPALDSAVERRPGDYTPESIEAVDLEIFNKWLRKSVLMAKVVERVRAELGVEISPYRAGKLVLAKSDIWMIGRVLRGRDTLEGMERLVDECCAVIPLFKVLKICGRKLQTGNPGLKERERARELLVRARDLELVYKGWEGLRCSGWVES